MESNLKPCPFCGDESPILKTEMISELGFAYTKVQCLACGASIGAYSEAERAIWEWNRRAPEIVKVEVPFYDKEEIHENCTVQVLTNTATGDVSVGWWHNE